MLNVHSSVWYMMEFLINMLVFPLHSDFLSYFSTEMPIEK